MKLLFWLLAISVPFCLPQLFAWVVEVFNGVDLTYPPRCPSYRILSYWGYDE